MTTTSCLFCRFARQEAGCHQVFRDASLLAFLDNAPIRAGHVQIIPLAHHETFEVLPAELGHGIMDLARRIAAVQKCLFRVDRVAFLFTGGDIPHAHAHLVPMVDKHDITSPAYIEEKGLTFAPAAVKGDTELAEVAARIATALEQHEG